MEKIKQNWHTYCGGKNWYVIASDGDVIARIPSDEQEREIAQFIASVPDMYEALKELSTIVLGVIEYQRGTSVILGMDSFTLQPAENALAKAEGK